MKKYFIFVLFSLMALSCNNEKDSGPGKQPLADAREKELMESISLYPDSLLLREDLIQYYREIGNYERAIAETNHTILLDSNLARLWEIKGSLYFENEDSVNAIKAYERAVKLSPDPKYINALGILYARTSNVKALEMANALSTGKNSKKDKDALFIKGLYHTYMGNKQKAIAYFDSCIAEDYTFMFAYREKAIALYDLGKYEEALNLLKKAVTLQNNFEEGYYWSGKCLEKLKRTAEAIENYQTALFYDPEYVEAKAELARLGAAGGN